MGGSRPARAEGVSLLPGLQEMVLGRVGVAFLEVCSGLDLVGSREALLLASCIFLIIKIMFC